MIRAVPGRRSLLDVSAADVGDLMDHTPQSAYAHLRATQPRWFLTPHGDSAIGIMRWPMVEGQVLHRDEDRVVLEDPVVLPDGQHARRLRLLSVRPEHEVAVLPLLAHGVVLTERFQHATRTWHWEIPRAAGVEGLADTDNAARQLQEQLGASASELIGLGQVHPDPRVLADPVLLYAGRIDTVGEVAAGGIRRVWTVPFAEAEEMALTGLITDAVTISALFRARHSGLTG
ncbi:NUDIX hydrolase [Streptomyces collinus]|uniref:NUDIX hydrolase n=1 Tax=Streptomyces collinus TaxID=42684 RepID=UPI0036D1B58E